MVRSELTLSKLKNYSRKKPLNLLKYNLNIERFTSGTMIENLADRTI